MKKANNVELSDQETLESISSFDQVPAAMTLILKRQKSIEEMLRKISNPDVPQSSKPPITSITELAKFLNVARCTAQALKNSGRIPYIQYGKKLVIDPDKVLASLNGYKPKRRKVPAAQVQ